MRVRDEAQENTRFSEGLQQPVVNPGVVLSQNADPVFHAVWATFRMMRVCLAIGPGEANRISDILNAAACDCRAGERERRESAVHSLYFRAEHDRNCDLLFPGWSMPTLHFRRSCCRAWQCEESRQQLRSLDFLDFSHGKEKDKALLRAALAG